MPEPTPGDTACSRALAIPEILSAILSHLSSPPDILIRARCVSTSWKKVVDTSPACLWATFRFAGDYVDGPRKKPIEEYIYLWRQLWYPNLSAVGNNLEGLEFRSFWLRWKKDWGIFRGRPWPIRRVLGKCNCRLRGNVMVEQQHAVDTGEEEERVSVLVSPREEEQGQNEDDEEENEAICYTKDRFFYSLASNNFEDETTRVEEAMHRVLMRRFRYNSFTTAMQYTFITRPACTKIILNFSQFYDQDVTDLDEIARQEAITWRYALEDPNGITVDKFIRAIVAWFNENEIRIVQTYSLVLEWAESGEKDIEVMLFCTLGGWWRSERTMPPNDVVEEVLREVEDGIECPPPGDSKWSDITALGALSRVF
ncbi:hypothetical protein BDZ91DRAFT_796300 [Kalaharituber pfeilii]|nr:hypothetical protein BDZ91DRAFT_796300 [Kalaharituber pfeilii]